MSRTKGARVEARTHDLFVVVENDGQWVDDNACFGARSDAASLCREYNRDDPNRPVRVAHLSEVVPANDAELSELRRVYRAAVKEFQVHQDNAYEPCTKRQCSLCRAVSRAQKARK